MTSPLNTMNISIDHVRFNRCVLATGCRSLGSIERLQQLGALGCFKLLDATLNLFLRSQYVVTLLKEMVVQWLWRRNNSVDEQITPKKMCTELGKICKWWPWKKNVPRRLQTAWDFRLSVSTDSPHGTAWLRWVGLNFSARNGNWP
jgi:hypothetical protein